MLKIVHSTVKSLKARPKAGSIESKHLVSHRNGMWFYELPTP
jgi:hypothetical protein